MPDEQQNTENRYVPISERLQNLKTRLDERDYNEEQQVLFTKLCDGLTADAYQKVCRFITDCDVPSLEMCLVDINYKESIPPSHPTDPLPINLLANLQTCCEPGRIACPELIMYSIEPENSIEDMMLHDCTELSTGRLCVGIDFKNRVMCCESEEDFDFIEILPSIQLDYSCEFGSFEVSGEYYESIELCYKRIEFLRRYHMWLDICEHDLSFESELVPIAETCLACDTSYETSAEASVENPCGNLTLKIKKNTNIDWCTPSYEEEFSIEFLQDCDDPKTYRGRTTSGINVLGTAIRCTLEDEATVDWCSGEVDLKPKLKLSCSANPVQGQPSMFNVQAKIPGCTMPYELVLNGSGSIASTLGVDGSISSRVSLNNITGTGALGPSAGIAFIKDITISGNSLKIEPGYMMFRGGIFCGVDYFAEKTIDITKVINCASLRKRCNLCECSDSSSSSSSGACPCFTMRSTTSDNVEVVGATMLVNGVEVPIQDISFTKQPGIGGTEFIVQFSSCDNVPDYGHVYYSNGSFATALITAGCEQHNPEESSSSGSISWCTRYVFVSLTCPEDKMPQVAPGTYLSLGTVDVSTSNGETFTLGLFVHNADITTGDPAIYNFTMGIPLLDKDETLSGVECHLNYSYFAVRNTAIDNTCREYEDPDFDNSSSDTECSAIVEFITTPTHINANDESDIPYTINGWVSTYTNISEDYQTLPIVFEFIYFNQGPGMTPDTVKYAGRVYGTRFEIEHLSGHCALDIPGYGRVDIDGADIHSVKCN